MRNYTLSLVLLTYTTNLFASPTVKDIPPGDDKIVVVREGDKVPFSGQLFDTPTALRWSNWLLQYKFRLTSDVDYQKLLAKTETDYLKNILSLEKSRYVKVTEDYQKQVAEEKQVAINLRTQYENPPFYKTVWFGLLTGVLLSAAVVGVGLGVGFAAAR